MEKENKTVAQLVAEQKNCENWLRLVAPSEFPGYVNDGPHGDANCHILFEYIYRELDGWITIKNLSLAAEACHLRLHGLGIHHAESKAARVREAAAKVEADRLQKVTEANQAVITAWLARECPLGLLVYGDLYGSSQDKVIAFIRRNFPNQDVITPAMLSQAVTTLGPALDWFSAEDHELRNQPPPPPRKLSERAQIEAGLKADSNNRPTHANDGKFVSLQESAKKMKAIVEKRLGLPSEEEHFRNKAEAISVSNRLGRFDHAKTQQLRATFAYKDPGKTIVDWRRTAELRDQLATQIEKEKNH